MGFWRNVGYIINSFGIIICLILFPIGLLGIWIPLVFIWMLKKSARDERMERHLRHMDPHDTMAKNVEDFADYKAQLEKEYKSKLYDLERKFKKE